MERIHAELNEGILIMVDVVVLKMTRALDQLFTYLLPPALIETVETGSKVVVPFGQNDATHEAVVVRVYQVASDHVTSKTKSVTELCDTMTALDERRIELALWIRETYLTNYSEAVSLLLPAGTVLKRDYKLLPSTDIVEDTLSEDERMLLGRLTLKPSLQSDLNESEVLVMQRCLKKGHILRHEHLSTAVRERYQRVFSLKAGLNAADILAALPERSSVMRAVIEKLRDFARMNETQLKKETRVTTAGLAKLAKNGWIISETEETFSFPSYYDSGREDTFIALSNEQKQAFDRISPSVIQNENISYVLHGVTGSGKTEVYMELSDLVLSQGRQVILLVPEISLTPQLVDRFRRRFGDRIAILHSRMNAAQRFDQWRAIARGEYDIIIGARSALFAPCREIGLIVVDEAHDASYKSDHSPRYHAIQVAEKLSELHGAPLVLGSATPGIDLYHEARSGQRVLVEMTRRFSQVELPEVEIVDMRKELIAGNRSMFSASLENAIIETLEGGQQIMLLLNRKGYHTFISCRSCGYALKCPNCDVSLIFHKGQNHARCSYCQFRAPIPATCPECGSRYFKFFGSGTEKVEEAFRERFPGVTTARMDSETLSKKGALETILSEYESGQTKALIGTQLISKGLDFANVGLVGVILADVTLNLPDFQANERTFQLLTQVGGRSGRARKRGRVVVQTYVPEHFSIRRAAEHDFLGFYEEETSLRASFAYPPFYQMANILVSGLKLEQVEKRVQLVYDDLADKLLVAHKDQVKDKMILLGPSPAIYSKIKNRYRWQIIIKYKEEILPLLREVLRTLPCEGNDVRCSIDIRALNVM